MARLARLDSMSSARLARLPVSSNELPKFSGQLGKIANYVGKISNVKSQMSKVKSTSQNAKVLREDQTKGECLTQKEAMRNAKNVHNGFFMTGAVFEE